MIQHCKSYIFCIDYLHNVSDFKSLTIRRAAEETCVSRCPESSGNGIIQHISIPTIEPFRPLITIGILSLIAERHLLYPITIDIGSMTSHIFLCIG